MAQTRARSSANRTEVVTMTATPKPAVHLAAGADSNKTPPDRRR
jgi:hypothetical protein